ncbi:MAG: hypothetical protein NTY48_02840 [Candidatus Diapherotrites archaeon]|nr:hypothetical protein [Candidatus Diapherotrites archaeon]
MSLFRRFGQAFFRHEKMKGFPVSNESIGYSNGGRVNFILNGKRYVVNLVGMSDRKIKAVKTGNFITLVGMDGKVIKEIQCSHMEKRNKVRSP